jgi:hypothetical protein
MRWHKEDIRENIGIMGHPSDGEAWKVLENFDVDFTSDARNVRIGDKWLLTIQYKHCIILLLAHLYYSVQSTPFSLHEI